MMSGIIDRNPHNFGVGQISFCYQPKEEILSEQYNSLTCNNCEILSQNSIYDVVTTCFDPADNHLNCDLDDTFRDLSRILNQNTSPLKLFHQPVTKSAVDLAITVYVLTVGVEHAFKLMNPFSDYESFDINSFTAFVEKYTNKKITANLIEQYCQNIQKSTSMVGVKIKCNNYVFEVKNLSSILDIYINDGINDILERNKIQQEDKDIGSVIANPTLMAKNFIHVASNLQISYVGKSSQQQLDIENKRNIAIKLGYFLLNKMDNYVNDKEDKKLLADLCILMQNCDCYSSYDSGTLAYNQIMRIFSTILCNEKINEKIDDRNIGFENKIGLLKHYLAMYEMFDYIATANSLYYYGKVSVKDVINLYAEAFSIFNQLYNNGKYASILSDIGFILHNQQLKISLHNPGIVSGQANIQVMDKQFMEYVNLALDNGSLFTEKLFSHICPFIFISKRNIPPGFIELKKFNDVLMFNSLEEDNICMVYRNFETEINTVTIDLYNASTIIKLTQSRSKVNNPFTRGAIVFLTIDDLKKYKMDNVEIKIENPK